jgi:hypothetical protein
LEARPLVFGVYPFGIAGGPGGVVSGLPDDIGLIGEALQGLAGDGPPLLVRLYVTFEGAVEAALDQVAQFPNALEALVDGVVVAAETKKSMGATAALGFTTASDTTPGAESFWRRVALRAGRAFSSAVEFAGLTMYPGGFEPLVLSAAELVQRTTDVLSCHRAQLSTAGIPATVPMVGPPGPAAVSRAPAATGQNRWVVWLKVPLAWA